MSFKTQLASDLAVFFNTAEFAELVVYNGSSVPAIVDRLKSQDSEGRELDSGGISDIAEVYIKVADIPNVQYQDVVQIDSVVWVVESILKYDENIWQIRVRKNEGYVFAK